MTFSSSDIQSSGEGKRLQQTNRQTDKKDCWDEKQTNLDDTSTPSIRREKKKRKNRKKEVEKSFGQVNNQQKKVARQGKEKSDFY
jgi:hypothetical protein